jgi:HK97 family phage portal protein
MKWSRRLTLPFRALGTALKGFSMRWAGGSGWWPMFLPRTKFDYAGEIGDGSRSNLVVACINWIARTFPEAPVVLVQENADGSREVIPRHAMPQKIERPNPFYSGVLLWMATIADHQLTGNAYWLKARAGLGRGIAELWWAPSWAMEPKWPDDGKTFISHYEYRPDPGRDAIKIDPGDVVHFRYGLDPQNTRKGFSPLRSLMREIFTDEEAANFTAALMRNLGVPGVVLSPESTDARPNEEQAKEMKEAFMAKFGGDRRGEPMVLEVPTKVQVLSFSPEQMLLRELRRVPEERVCAVIGVPAIVVGLGAGLERSTFTNMGEAKASAWDSVLIPAQRLMAADLEIQLLPDFDTKPNRDVDFDLTRVRALQPAMTELYTRMSGAVNAGWVTQGQALRAVGLPAGPEHDVYLRQMTVIEVPEQTGTKARKQMATKAMKHVAAIRRRLAITHRPLFEKVAIRLVAREREAIMAAAQTSFGSKSHADFDAAIDALYGSDYAGEVEGEIMPALVAYGGAMQGIAAAEVGAEAGMTPALQVFLAAYATSFAARWIGSSRGQVLSVAGDAVRAGEDPLAAVATRLGEWEVARPGKMAAWETVQAGNAVARETYREAGVQRLVWVAGGKACPYCEEMDGKTVEITTTFLGAGDSLNPEGGDGPMTTTVELGHPPLHDGCECDVMAA